MRVLLTVSYDGTNYCGWQRQLGQTTIQQVIENGLSALYGRELIILGASRTDSGVHALGQRASFTPPDGRIPLKRLHLAINSKLPGDIRVLSAEAVSDCFHVINDAKRKTYVYRIQNREVYEPILYRCTHHVKEALNIDTMRQAACFLLGEHDFKAFCAAHGGAATTIRTIYDLSLSNKDGVISMEICGSGFLYNMVRIVMGTLVRVGLGKAEPSSVREILLSGNRGNAGATLPAKGLTLVRVEY